MQNIFTTLRLIMLCAMAAFAASTHAASPKVKIMTYNVRNGIGIDRNTSLLRVASTIRKECPDVVCLQELDSATTRSHGSYILGQLASMLGMHPEYSPAIDFQGGKYGIGILSHQTPIAVSRLALPGSEEERTLIIADFGSYAVACVHLSLTHSDQLLSVPLIVAEAQKYGKPLILCGDFNALPNSDTITELRKHFSIISQTKHATYPADKPTDLIDYIMLFTPTSGGTNVSKAHRVNGSLASDHLPQCVTVSPANQ